MSEMLSEAELVASICRSDFKFFVKEFAGINIPGKFTWGWHLDVMCDHLQEVAERMFRGEGKKEDLVCNVSPGTTKSSIFSVLFPAWVWTRMPEAQFICVSYSHLLSLDLSRKCRDVVKSDKYRACFPDVVLRDDADAKGYFINTAGGKRYSAGSRGTVLGMHAHFICFPYETLVQTNIGNLPIGKIVEDRLDVSVLGADHFTGQLCWQKIEKYEWNSGRPLCRVEFDDASSLELTHDHPVFVKNRGYIFASDLLPGDEVIYVDQLQSLSKETSGEAISSDENEIQESNLLQGMQSSCDLWKATSLLQTDQRVLSYLLPLSQEISMPKEETEVFQIRQGVLFQNMCRRKKAQESFKGMSLLQEAIRCVRSKEIHCQLLQSQVSGDENQREESSKMAESCHFSMSNLWDEGKNQNWSFGENPEPVLFAKMRQCSSQSKNEGNSKSKIHSRTGESRLFGEVSTDVDFGSEERQAQVLSLSVKGNTKSPRCSSHRLRQEERRHQQSCNVMQMVPRPDARETCQSFVVGKKTVCSVVREIRNPEKVYNLSVSKEHNYFANGVLVHNCIDDPLDPTRALSEIELDTINYWMKTTLSSRKVDKSQSVTILVMQRLHQDDPSAQMLMRPDVKHICLPATTEYPIKPPELADKYIDGLMDPIRLPKAYLEEVSGPGGIGEAAYAGQYGQQPFPPGGNMFKVGNLRWGIAPDTFKRLVRAWDKAATVSKAISTKGPAYTVGTKLGLDYSGRIWVLDVRRVRVDSFKREELIKKTAIMDGREVIVVVEQEPGSGGKDSALGTIKRLMGYRVRAIPASGSKEIRADEFSVAVNGGLVWIPAMFRDGNHWVGWAYEWVEELKHFPHSSYLDQVDSASLGFGELARGRVRVGAITNTTQREFV